MPIIACLQFTTGETLTTGLEYLDAQVAHAAQAGAEWVFTPEMSLQLLSGRRRTLEYAPVLDDPTVMQKLSNIAMFHNIWLFLGSAAFTLPRAHQQKADTSLPICVNRSFVFNPSGHCLTYYDKIHLFDVELGHESYRESATYKGGTIAPVVKVNQVSVGLTICYDIRFPQLFRGLADAGAQIIAVPAAFTVPTGRAHWHTLLQARAIETGCYIVAAAQTGTHSCGRQTWGHSCIVSPTGNIMADAKDATAPHMIISDLSL